MKFADIAKTYMNNSSIAVNSESWGGIALEIATFLSCGRHDISEEQIELLLTVGSMAYIEAMKPLPQGDNATSSAEISSIEPR